MLIRKNSKAFKSIRNILYDYQNTPSKIKLIKLYITKAGHTVKDKIDIESLNQEKNFYYDLTYQTILDNLDSKDHLLHESDEQQNLFFFRRTGYKTWDETPFQLAAMLRNKFPEFEKPMATTSKEKNKALSIKHEKELKSLHLRPPVSRKKINKDENIKSSATEAFHELRLKEDRSAKTDHTRVANKPSIIPPEEPKQPDYNLKHPIQFTYLDKTVIHEQNITKLHLLDYYDQMSEFILPYLKDRPQFFRWHRGSIRESQYNKSIESLTRDWKGILPDWIQTEKIYSKTSKEERTYILCPDKDHLLYLIELGCIELNPWHSRIKNIDYPDYIIIDLDPVSIDFDLVIEVAQAAKEVLDGIKVPSSVKTSGNRGLHIYIPLDSKTNYEISRNLCESICKMIHLKAPQLTSLQRIPDQRKGKVYLDYLQNAKGKSIVAPYSIRPNDFAAVATPLDWKEVKEGLSIYEFNYQTIFKRLKQHGDHFKDLFKKKVNAEKVLLQLQDRYGFLL